jgi:hypothetical protein
MYLFQISKRGDRYKIINAISPNLTSWIASDKTIESDDPDLFDFVYEKLHEGYSLYISKSERFSGISIDDIEVVQERTLQQAINIIGSGMLDKLSEMINLQAAEYIVRYIPIIITLIRNKFDESALTDKDRMRLKRIETIFEAYNKYMELYDKLLTISTMEELGEFKKYAAQEMNAIVKEINPFVKGTTGEFSVFG